MAKCKNCGTKLSDNVKFCSKCGTRVERDINAVVCKNGHHYDYSKYGDECPHCVRENKEIDVDSQVQKDLKPEQSISGRGQFFSFLHKRKEEKKLDNTDVSSSSVLQKMENLELKNEISEVKQMEKHEELDMGQEDSFQSRGELEKIVRSLDSQEPKTQSLWRNMDYIKKNDTEENIGQKNKGKLPIGWLVCVKSVNSSAIGKNFELYEGKNFIGRDMELNVCVRDVEDSTISRRHTVIKYDPMIRKIKLLPSEGDGLVYINEQQESVDEVTELKDRDFIQIGKTRFILICLCGENFSWEDWLNEGEMP